MGGGELHVGGGEQHLRRGEQHVGGGKEHLSRGEQHVGGGKQHLKNTRRYYVSDSDSVFMVQIGLSSPYNIKICLKSIYYTQPTSFGDPIMWSL